jgi:hypothetical protein
MYREDPKRVLFVFLMVREAGGVYVESRVVQPKELAGREQEASRKPSTGRRRRFAFAVSMRLSSSPVPVPISLHQLRHGHRSAIRNVRSQSIPQTRIDFHNRYLQHIQSSHGRHKLISQWPDNPLQIPKAPQPRSRRSTSSASRNNQWRASSSPGRESSVQ